MLLLLYIQEAINPVGLIIQGCQEMYGVGDKIIMDNLETVLIIIQLFLCK